MVVPDVISKIGIAGSRLSDKFAARIALILTIYLLVKIGE